MSDGDDACVADFFEEVSKFLTDLLIAVGRDGSNALDLGAVFDLD